MDHGPNVDQTNHILNFELFLKIIPFSCVGRTDIHQRTRQRRTNKISSHPHALRNPLERTTNHERPKLNDENDKFSTKCAITRRHKCSTNATTQNIPRLALFALDMVQKRAAETTFRPQTRKMQAERHVVREDPTKRRRGRNHTEGHGSKGCGDSNQNLIPINGDRPKKRKDLSRNSTKSST